jgi:hypothetical protein
MFLHVSVGGQGILVVVECIMLKQIYLLKREPL